MKFVIWGIGLRGKKIFNLMDKNQIIVIIESNKELIGTTYENIPIIDFELYCAKYTDYYLIITPLFHKEIIDKLKELEIFRFFLLTDCQAELEYGGYEFSINEYPIPVYFQNTYLIYGLTLWSILIYEHLANNNCRKIYILPHKAANNSIVRDLADSINFVNVDGNKKIKCDKLLVAFEDKDEAYKGVLVGDYVIEDMFDFSEQFASYRNRDIEQFHNIHFGKRCFIIGNGPSLKMTDLELLHSNQEICFGVNRIYLSQKNTKWRPSYYVVEDSKCIMCYEKEILDFECGEKFIGDTYLPFWENSAIEQNIHKYHSHGKSSIAEYHVNPKFSTDFSKKAYAAYTVIYSCFQLAVYMGFKEIFLLGVDCDFEVDRNGEVDRSVQNHFSPHYFDGLENIVTRTNTVGMIKAYESAKQYADTHGIKIYNATRGGKLEVFERVDFDSLF
nr:6-hydroxymethylpterin diphosphokinase MptE-like protein [uncultured Desulfobacter sp.]